MTEQANRNPPGCTCYLDVGRFGETSRVERKGCPVHAPANEQANPTPAVRCDCARYIEMWYSTTPGYWHREECALYSKNGMHFQPIGPQLAANPTQAPEPHAYKPLPRGDHEITVRLCYDCDNWHASDDSVLYNEGRKRDWEAKLAVTEQLAAALRTIANYDPAYYNEKGRPITSPTAIQMAGVARAALAAYEATKETA